MKPFLWSGFLVFTMSILTSTYPISAQQAPLPPKPAESSKSSSKDMSINGDISVPAYSLVHLQAGNVTGNSTWIVITSINNQITQMKGFSTINGSDFLFTGQSGQYLVILTNNGIHTQTNVTIQSPSVVNPQPTPTPPPPNPAVNPDTGEFVYPSLPAPTGQGTGQADSKSWQSNLTNGVASALLSAPNKQKVYADAKALSILYNALASALELDGLYQTPVYTSINQVTLLVKKEESNLLASQSLQSLKDIYPDISKHAGETFVSLMKPWQAEDKLGPKARDAYVSFLKSLAAGFDKARTVQ